MNTSKKIDVNISSLVSLKAELSRKQEEVEKAKATEQAGYIRPIPQPKKQTVWSRKNVGLDERSEKDAEEIKAEEDIHKKSRAALEAKSKLYDKIAEASTSRSFTDDDNRYLVNFEEKYGQPGTSDAASASKHVEEEEKSDVDEYVDEHTDPDDDWVEYVDCLGRTRKSLRRDLDFVKNKDIQLAKSLYIHPEEPKPTDKPDGEVTSTSEPEMLSNDMRREQLRQKWEEQEEALRDKTDIHYQDVLFDEARAHGVGYYAFSQQEEERSAQQQALNKQRQETQQQQEVARGLRERRQQQLEARLKAARQRNRARRGLPPEEDEPGPTPEEVRAAAEAEEAKKKAAEEEEATRLAKESKIRSKTNPVRQWDVGKEGVTSSFTPMSQEEWVKKKREERPEEFAPLYKENSSASDSRARKRRLIEGEGSGEPSSSAMSWLWKEKVIPQQITRMEPTKIRNELTDSSSEEEDTRGTGPEIGPPPPHSYTTSTPAPRNVGYLSKEDIERSVAVGLAKLRREHEEKRKRGENMPVDIL